MFKVTVHLERCFQFSVYNFVKMHRTSTTYIAYEIIKTMVKRLFNFNFRHLYFVCQFQYHLHSYSVFGNFSCTHH